MAEKRIIEYTEASTVTNDDYVYMDSEVNGQQKITPNKLVSMSQAYYSQGNSIIQLGEHVDDVESAMQSIVSDVGDLTGLDTDDKSSVVNAVNELKGDIEELQQGGSGSGLTADIKQALLDCFENVAWIGDDGQTYYDALSSALYPPADLVSISALYAQSGTVYDTDTLDSLKPDLVVTALYDDQTTETVTTYTLSGTLTEGTSTITVAYGGKTDTFNVTVTKASDVPAGYTQYDYLTATDTTGDYVDTGIVASSLGYNSFSALSTTIRIKMTSVPSAETNIMGCRATSTGTGNTGTYQFFGETNGAAYGYLLGAGVETTDVLSAGTVTDIVYTYNDGSMSKLAIGDGTGIDVANVASSNIQSNNKSLVLYGSNRNGVKVVGCKQIDVMEVGRITMKNTSSTTVLDFVPAYSDNDQKYGFYETVHSTFYGCNLGTLTGGNWS